MRTTLTNFCISNITFIYPTFTKSSLVHNLLIVFVHIVRSRATRNIVADILHPLHLPMLRYLSYPLNARILHLHIRIESMSNGMIDDAFLQTKISITLGSEEGYLVVYFGKFRVKVGDYSLLLFS